MEGEMYETEGFDEDSYENDLQLAAELGKALLERNRELETTVLQLQSTNQEQNIEVQCLMNKIETMKTMSESRMRVYEELDKNALELEKTNQKLTMEAKADKQKIERLQSTVDGLETRAEELQNKVEELKKKESNNNCQQRQNARRASSLASLTDSGDNKGFYLDNLQWTYKEQFKKLPLNPYEVEIRQLQEKNDQLKTQVGIYKRKTDDLTVELSILVAENADLDEKVKVLEDKIDIYHCMEYQLRQAAHTPTGPHVCAECGKGISFSQESQDLILNEVEHDAPVLLSQAKAVKLGGGGSMYSSTESINAVATDAKEISDEGGAAAGPRGEAFLASWSRSTDASWTSTKPWWQARARAASGTRSTSTTLRTARRGGTRSETETGAQRGSDPDQLDVEPRLHAGHGPAASLQGTLQRSLRHAEEDAH